MGGCISKTSGPYVESVDVVVRHSAVNERSSATPRVPAASIAGVPPEMRSPSPRGRISRRIVRDFNNGKDTQRMVTHAENPKGGTAAAMGTRTRVSPLENEVNDIRKDSNQPLTANEVIKRLVDEGTHIDEAVDIANAYILQMDVSKQKTLDELQISRYEARRNFDSKKLSQISKEGTKLKKETDAECKTVALSLLRPLSLNVENRKLSKGEPAIKAMGNILRYVATPKNNDPDFECWKTTLSKLLEQFPELKKPVPKVANYFWAGNGVPGREEFQNLLNFLKLHPEYKCVIHAEKPSLMQEAVNRLDGEDLWRGENSGLSSRLSFLTKGKEEKGKEEGFSLETAFSLMTAIKSRIQIQDIDAQENVPKEVASIITRERSGPYANYPAAKDAMSYPLLKEGGVMIDWDIRFHKKLPELNAPFGILVNAYSNGRVNNSIIAAPKNSEVVKRMTERMIDFYYNKCPPALLIRMGDVDEWSENRKAPKSAVHEVMWYDKRVPISKKDNHHYMVDYRKTLPRFALTLATTGPGLVQNELEKSFGEHCYHYRDMCLFSNPDLLQDSCGADWMLGSNESKTSHSLPRSLNSSLLKMASEAEEKRRQEKLEHMQESKPVLKRS